MADFFKSFALTLSTILATISTIFALTLSTIEIFLGNWNYTDAGQRDKVTITGYTYELVKIHKELNLKKFPNVDVLDVLAYLKSSLQS